MRIARTIIILSSLFLASSILTAQKDSNSKAATEPSASASTHYWNETRDVRSWLIENEAVLHRGDGCTLTVSWMSADDPKRPSSAVHEIASFALTPEDEQIAKVFRDSASNSNLEVRVGVRYVRGGSLNSPYLLLQIALAVDGSADGVFDEMSRSEAATLRDATWKQLSVVKAIRVGHLDYRYSLNCENGRTFLGFLRHPAKQNVRNK